MTSIGEICMSDLVTSTNHAPDTGIADMGFHYFEQESPPPDLQVEIILTMPSVWYTPGDMFRLKAHTRSLTGKPVRCNMFIFLEMGGDYWFYPTWRMFGPPKFMVDYKSIIADDEERAIIHPFDWPFVPFSMDGLLFYGICSDRDLTCMVSNIDIWEWGFGL